MPKKKRAYFLDSAIRLRINTIKYIDRVPENYKIAFGRTMEESCARVFYCLNSANSIYLDTASIPMEFYMLREVFLERARVELKSFCEDVDLLYTMMKRSYDIGVGNLTEQDFFNWAREGTMLLSAVNNILKSDKERMDSVRNNRISTYSTRSIEEIFDREMSTGQMYIDQDDYDLEFIDEYTKKENDDVGVQVST